MVVLELIVVAFYENADDHARAQFTRVDGCLRRSISGISASPFMGNRGQMVLVTEPLSAYRGTFERKLRELAAPDDPLYYAVIGRPSGLAVGRAALMRIDTANRVIEVGSIVYGSRLQRTRAATEAMYLLAQYVFDTLRYRRYEWKCN